MTRQASMGGRDQTRMVPRPWLVDASPATRRWLLRLSLAYLLFVIYGSLVPLTFQPVPWSQALDRFSAIPYLQLGIDSRADWVANVLLFIPLSFLWSTMLWPGRGAGGAAFAAVLVVGAAAVLSVTIEFTQVFFPPRTVSINDIVAENLGALIGALIYAWQRRRFCRWMDGLPLIQGTLALTQHALWAYLLVLFGYSLLPLDLTISPVEIYHKWREGKVVIVPFTAAYRDTAHRVYDLLTDALVWLPVAILWRASGPRSRSSALGFVVASATLLELLQLLVYSRVTDTTDIVTAAIGALVGGAFNLVGALGPSTNRPVAHPLHPAAWPWVLAVIAWLGVLALVFWYPFDFHFERVFLRDRVDSLSWVPFNTFYQGSEFRAATEVLHKTLFLAPLGVLLGRWARCLTPARSPALVRAFAWSLMLATSLAIEAGQLLLPGKSADLTDVMLEFLGALAGFQLSSWVPRRLGASSGQADEKR